jgi:hypothetical protein
MKQKHIRESGRVRSGDADFIEFTVESDFESTVEVSGCHR